MSCFSYTVMELFTKVIVLAAVVLITNADPSCVFDEDQQTTVCTADNSDYILKRGLVSDNNETRSITLRGCRIIDIYLESFSNLIILKNLDLAENKIKKLRLGVFQGLKELTHLDLVGNMIPDLPVGIFEATPKLELLNLKGNRLNNLEVGVFDPIPRLGFLDLSGNAFLGQDLSPLLFDKQFYITFMDFSGSDMKFAPDDLLKRFKIINFLNLSGCSLIEVPKFATSPNLKSMHHLMMINNIIESIEDPKTFENLPNLGMLNFGGNNIEILHEDVFKSLKKLTSVVLFGNKLKSIPDTLFFGLNKLTDVDLSSNALEVIPVNAFRGTALKNLNLSNNKFTYLSDNFILELSNSGAVLKTLMFEKNPWQCACLRDIMKEAKARGVEYSPQGYDGKNKECVTTKEFSCKRQPDSNQFFVDKFYGKGN